MILIKIGGGKNINWEYIAQDIKDLKEQVIIVHGANAWMTEISQKLGLTERTIISPSGQTSRYTDNKTMDLITMVYSGLINKKIVATLQKFGLNAIGLAGVDGKLWLGKRKDVILSQEGTKIKTIRDSLTGNVISVNKKLIALLLGAGYIPVLTIPAITEKGEMINVDNDRAVALMVKDLNIKTVIMLFEAPGLLKDKDDEKLVIKTIKFDQLDKYIKNSEGRMRKKLLGMKEAFTHGLPKAYFGDGRIKSPITAALKGGGTIIS
ncbi:[LysW]-aminoadipate kinase [Candidatus Gottesmanbacteria bacterium]|nr:[LysW]-aminoadipate kinase [Candidatus Gottesmanbacteria bacterium]